MIDAVEILILAEEVREAEALDEPLKVLRLQELASDVIILRSDTEPGRTLYDRPHVVIVEPVQTPVFQVQLTYRLPSTASSLELVAELPLDRLLVEVPKGSVEARPDPTLARAGEGGPASRPRLLYVGESFEPEQAERIRFTSSRLEWRDRLAVLIAVGLAASAAAIWVWRGNSAARRPAG